jgi:hypothetical protein
MTYTENRFFLTQAWLPALIAACLAIAVQSSAQNVTGEVAVGNTLGNGQNSSQIFLDAMQFSGQNPTKCSGGPNPLHNDMCGQIQAAICAAPSPNGVTIDARGFTATQACQTNPFASPTDSSGATLTTTPVTLLLPGQTITSTVPWFLPAQSKTIGQNQNVTIIQWAGAAQGSTNCTVGTGTQTCVPVVCMGKPDPTTHNCDTPGEFANTPRTQISGLKIDCHNALNMFGLVDITAQEQSWFQNGGVENCPGAGVFIGPTGHNTGTLNPPLPDANQVQNAGPFTNLEINWGNNPAAGTLGMYVQGGPSITVGVGGHITFNKTLNATGTAPNAALSVNGFQVSVANIHCENYVDCVLLGSNSNTLAASVHNITIADSATNAVHVASGKTVTGVVSAVGCVGGSHAPPCSGTNSIKDDQISPPFADSNQFLSSYVVGPSGTAYSNFVARGNSIIDAISNVVGSYNGTATMGIGLAAVYGTANKTGQSGSILSTPIISSTATTGEYIIHYYADQRTQCSSGGGTMQFTFSWTDGTGNRSAAPTGLSLLTITGSGSYIQGAIPVYAAIGTAISYSSSVTGSCVGGKYDVHASAEQTQ